MVVEGRPDVQEEGNHAAGNGECSSTTTDKALNGEWFIIRSAELIQEIIVSVDFN